MTSIITENTTNGAPIESRSFHANKLPWTIEHVNSNIARYPEDTREAVSRLFTLGKQRGHSAGELADLVKMDDATIGRLFNGKYEAKDLTPITDRIFTALDRLESKTVSDELIAEISIVEDIKELCQLAWMKRRIAFIFGPTQAGKTKGLEWFRLHHPKHPLAAANEKYKHGKIRYVEMPTNAPACGFLNNLSKACLRCGRSSYNDMKSRCIDALSPNDLLIIDEFSRIFNPITGTIHFATIELVREIWTAVRCGLVLVMTDIAKDEMQTGKFHSACDQLYFRSVAELELDRVPCDKDLKIIAVAHGLPTPGVDDTRRIRTIVEARGMTRYANLLEMSCDIAAARGGKPTWQDFLAAYDTVARLAQKRSETKR